ncbi:MAG TPA: hypothetical protein VLD36_09250, partial [Burkholderiales bacterium]|nr:hypothetical protein [Burkholderiales bacterium]
AGIYACSRQRPKRQRKHCGTAGIVADPNAAMACLHYLAAQVRALRLAPSGSMDTEDVGDLQGGAPHAG